MVVWQDVMKIWSVISPRKKQSMTDIRAAIAAAVAAAAARAVEKSRAAMAGNAP